MIKTSFDVDSVRHTSQRIHQPLAHLPFLTLWIGSFLALVMMPDCQLAWGQDDIQTSYRYKVGQAHADFVLPDIESGKLTPLSQFRGKKVLLLHFASW